jgi:hypothetical protein
MHRNIFEWRMQYVEVVWMSSHPPFSIMTSSCTTPCIDLAVVVDD